MIERNTLVIIILTRVNYIFLRIRDSGYFARIPGNTNFGR